MIKISMTTIGRRAMLGLALSTAAIGAWAQSYPNRPIKIVIPYPPGGPIDVIGRAVATKLGAALGGGQQVVVDNRPGANEIVGIPSVTKAHADGYTLLLHSDAAFTLNPLLYKSLPYETKELMPLTRVAMSQMVIAVPASLPVKTLADFVQYAKTAPKELSYGSSGAGSNTHLGMAWLIKQYKIPMVHVPYKGLAPALTDLIAGHVQVLMGSPSVMMPYAQSGTIKLLGVSGAKRLAALPDVPTYTQAGFPDIDENFYVALSAPAGLPAPIRDQLISAMHTVLKDPEFKKSSLDTFSFEPVVESQADFIKFLDQRQSMSVKKVAAAELSVN